jgi:hypothetical protein
MVQVPPRMQLDREQTVGIVGFDVQGTETAQRDVASQFLQAIQEGQPGVAVVELGSSAEVLSSVGKTALDREAAQEIGKKYDVDVVIVGTVTMKESKPKVDVGLDQGFKLSSLSAQVRLDGNLDAKLIDTDRGATTWTGSSSRWINLAHVGGNSAGYGSVDVADRDHQVAQLVYDMVQEASGDFRPTWERQEKP